MNYRASYRTILAFVFSLVVGCGRRAVTIHDAAKAGDVEKVRSLLVADPTVFDAKNNDGVTPLMYAAQGGNPEVVELLVKKGAAVEAKDNYGHTPLMFAAWNGNLAVVELLLEKGAAVEAKKNDGSLPPIRGAEEHVERIAAFWSEYRHAQILHVRPMEGGLRKVFAGKS